MTNLADTLLVAEVLSRANHGIPDDYQWGRMMEDIALDLEERTRPADDMTVLRDRRVVTSPLPAGDYFRVYPLGDLDVAYPCGIVYNPMVGENEL